MEFEHRPVLLEPTVDALLLADFGGKGASRSHPQSGPDAALRAERGVFVDGTFGRGGHSRELLSRLGQARLVVFDKIPRRSPWPPRWPRRIPGWKWCMAALPPWPKNCGNAASTRSMA